MSGAAALLRFVPRRRIPSLPGSHPKPQSWVLFFEGALPSMAASVPFSSRNLGSQSQSQAQNPLPAGAVEANEQKVVAHGEHIESKENELLESSRTKLPTWELHRQIEEKKGELLQLLQKQSPCLKESNKCLEEKEELLRLLRQFHYTTQCKETPHLDAAARFLCNSGFLLIFVAAIAVLRM